MGTISKILITVKTYPLPSKTYRELVYTAGVLEDGTHIRLYPIDLRYRPYWEWYKKYQWIEVEIEKNQDDPRPESYRPVHNARIKILSEPIKEWGDRKRFVFAKGVQTMCELQSLKQTVKSLGIIRVKEVMDLKIESTELEWKGDWQDLFRQGHLFGPDQKPLEKIPYKFSYHYKCEDLNCNSHTQMIEDWEVGQLFLKMRDKYKSEQIATEKVKEKFLGQICGPTIDTHFYVGTILKHASWVILGAFWPKKETLDLFGNSL